MIRNIGGHNEKTNIEVVENICELLDELSPNKPGNLKSYKDLITFVKDRPGHDTRYAIDASKIEKDLNYYLMNHLKADYIKLLNGI